jgi:hypothetical protein
MFISHKQECLGISSVLLFDHFPKMGSILSFPDVLVDDVIRSFSTLFDSRILIDVTQTFAIMRSCDNEKQLVSTQCDYQDEIVL